MAYETFFEDKGMTNKNGDFKDNDSLETAVEKNWLKELSNGHLYDPDTGREYTADGRLIN